MDQFSTIGDSFKAYYDQLAALIPNIIAGFVVLLVFWILSKYIQRILRLALDSQFEDELVLKFILKMVRVIFLLIGILVFFKIVGLGDLAFGLWGTAGIGAFILGFAFKDIGEHFLAGFILAFHRPFRTGDTVEINDIQGKVLGLNLRNTHLKTFDGKDVYIPNGIMIKNPLINYTIDGFIRSDFSVFIYSNTDMKIASDIILNCISKHEAVLKGDRAPFIQMSKIENSRVELKIYFWLDLTEEGVSPVQVKNDLARDVLLSLDKNNIELPASLIEIKS